MIISIHTEKAFGQIQNQFITITTKLSLRFLLSKIHFAYSLASMLFTVYQGSSPQPILKESTLNLKQILNVLGAKDTVMNKQMEFLPYRVHVL